jgi:hypothetical protein
MRKCSTKYLSFSLPKYKCSSNFLISFNESSDWNRRGKKFFVGPIGKAGNLMEEILKNTQLLLVMRKELTALHVFYPMWSVQQCLQMASNLNKSRIKEIYSSVGVNFVGFYIAQYTQRKGPFLLLYSFYYGVTYNVLQIKSHCTIQ